MEELILLDKRVTIENVLANSIVSENKHFYSIKYVCCFTFLVLTRRSLNRLPKIFALTLSGKATKAIMSEMAVKPCRTVLPSLFSISLNCSLVMKQTEFIRSGFCPDNPGALSLLSGK